MATLTVEKVADLLLLQDTWIKKQELFLELDAEDVSDGLYLNIAEMVKEEFSDSRILLLLFITANKTLYFRVK